MTSVFLAAASQGGSARGYRHLEQTVQSAVTLPGFDQPVAVWGARQRGAWSTIRSGDVVLFYTGNHQYRYAATVVATEQNRERARDLWSPNGSPGTDDGTGEWEYLIYLKDVREVAIDSPELHGWAGYGMDHLVRFQSLNDQGHREIRERYGSIEAYVDAHAIDDEPIAADWTTSSRGLAFDPTATVPDATVPDRSEATVSRVIRNSALVDELKAAYDHRCQVCDEQRRRGLDVYYAEGHHLHPLGRGGPDERANLLVLCPNHHADFDYGTIAVDPRSYELRHLYEDALNERVLTIRGDHEVASAYLEYHDQEIVIPKLRS